MYTFRNQHISTGGSKLSHRFSIAEFSLPLQSNYGSHPGSTCFVFFNKVCNPMDTQNKTALRKQFHKLISVREGKEKGPGGEGGSKSLYKCITLPHVVRQGTRESNV